MKYEGPKSYQSKDMANVKVFEYKPTEAQTRTGQKLHAPDQSMQGHENRKIVLYDVFQ